MADLRKLRARLKPVLQGVGGATVLVAGLTAACIETTSGNLMISDVQQVDTNVDMDSMSSGNLMPFDAQQVEETSTGDTGATDTGTPDSGATDTGTTTKPDTTSADWGSSGNLVPPDVYEVPKPDASTETDAK